MKGVGDDAYPPSAETSYVAVKDEGYKFKLQIPISLSRQGTDSQSKI